MRDWLVMASVSKSSLMQFEEKRRYYQLSESESESGIRRAHKAILKVLPPSHIVERRA